MLKVIARTRPDQEFREQPLVLAADDDVDRLARRHRQPAGLGVQRCGRRIQIRDADRISLAAVPTLPARSVAVASSVSVCPLRRPEWSP
jgi:hypothetical protein